MKAWELLAEGPHRWVKDWFALSIDGRLVDPLDEDACKFCMLGAIRKVYTVVIGQDIPYECYRRLEQRGIDNIAKFNDTHTYEEVLAVLKELDI